MDESGEELNNLLAEEKLAGVPLLVYANKQDLDLAEPEDELHGSRPNLTLACLPSADRIPAVDINKRSPLEITAMLSKEE